MRKQNSACPKEKIKAGVGTIRSGLRLRTKLFCPCAPNFSASVHQTFLSLCTKLFYPCVPNLSVSLVEIAVYFWYNKKEI